jgi:hypothetical protein
MKFKFENLIIWQKAMDFGEEINNAKRLPPFRSPVFRLRTIQEE